MNTKRVVELHADAEVIKTLGGPSKIAAKLGLAAPHGARRVNNWRYRGIPEILLLKRPDVFGKPGKARARNAA